MSTLAAQLNGVTDDDAIVKILQRKILENGNEEATAYLRGLSPERAGYEALLPLPHTLMENTLRCVAMETGGVVGEHLAAQEAAKEEEKGCHATEARSGDGSIGSSNESSTTTCSPSATTSSGATQATTACASAAIGRRAFVECVLRVGGWIGVGAWRFGCCCRVWEAQEKGQGVAGALPNG